MSATPGGQQESLTREVINFDGVLEKGDRDVSAGNEFWCACEYGAEVGHHSTGVERSFPSDSGVESGAYRPRVHWATTGLPFALREQKRGFKFTIGKTF
jgi:hypothetical protein